MIGRVIRDCPFCGCTAGILRRGALAADSGPKDQFKVACGYCGSGTGWWETAERAVTRWNTRSCEEDA